MRLPLIALMAAFLAAPWPVAAQETPGVAGAYLAARQAVIDGDHAEAALYFEQALRRDPENTALLGNALFARTALGDWDRALELTNQIGEGASGWELAQLIQQVARAEQGEFDAALEAIEAGQGAGALVDGLMQAWLHFGEGDMSRAVDGFEEIAADGPLAEIARYHLALARAAVGDFEGADAILSGTTYGPLPASARGIRSHAQILVQLDRTDDALELLTSALTRAPDPVFQALRDTLIADPTRPYDFVVSAQDGIAEVFYSLSSGLGSDPDSALPLIYARAAYALDPTHHDAQLLAADYLSDAGQPHLAADTYAAIPRDSVYGIEAEMGRADALFDMGEEDSAAEVLIALAAAHPGEATVHAALGDTLRRMERFAEAAAAYSAAVDLIDRDQTRYWFLFYARGITFEREDRWDEAEADFRHALTLFPDQPQVLNYLGYSLVEQRRNLDEALDMIERAVAAEPQSGYIVDSLGWVLYRLGRFDEAVEPMERAVALLPNDPIINDHLGDVYYMVGRFREAEFQWHRALSFEPEEAEAVRIRLKLERGLTHVLAEEEAEGIGGTQ